jgi:hypothetical protein
MQRKTQLALWYQTSLNPLSGHTDILDRLIDARILLRSRLAEVCLSAMLPDGLRRIISSVGCG